MTIYVVLMFLSILAGMAIAVRAFGTGGKRAKADASQSIQIQNQGLKIVISDSMNELCNTQKTMKVPVGIFILVPESITRHPKRHPKRHHKRII